MNARTKLKILGESAKYDLCNYATYSPETFISGRIPGIYNATSSNGCIVPLFKVLMTNKCSNDCKYCINHSNRKFTRVEFTPDELSNIFMDYYHKKYAEGLFLSSGVFKDIDFSMEMMIEVARKLRVENGYNGYIHLKILPGSSYDLIKRAMSLADRVSVNIEAATSSGFGELTTTKNYNTDILKRMKWIKRLSTDKNMAPSGQTTQFIVGAADESDHEILERTKWLYEKFEIKRSYFSTFIPIENTPLENHEEPHPKRTSRLYQADFLINSYGFSLEELIFQENGNLSTDVDPKYSVAKNNMDLFPVEINEASYRELLRVPGIGIISARRIIDSRRMGHCFNKLEELKQLGVVIKRAEPFIKLGNSYQTILNI